jgi:thymidylate synthase
VNFWKNGLDASSQIIGSRAPNPRFEQVPIDALERMRKQVDLVVIRQRTQEDVEKIITALIQEPEHAVPVPNDVELYSTAGKELLYDDGARFDHPFTLDLSQSAKAVVYTERKSDSPLGQTVHAEHLKDALEMVASYIYEHGDAFIDQRGIETRESRSFTISIKDPLAAIPKGYSETYLQNYLDEFMNGLKGADEFAYTYHERIFRRWGDQVETAIKVLKKDPRTRRCMISLWDQTEDLETESPPCLNFIWLVIRDNMLELHVVYRSHHLATVTKQGRLMEGEGAMVPNLYALSHLQKRIAGRMGLPAGPLVLTDFSGHIYVSGI